MGEQRGYQSDLSCKVCLKSNTEPKLVSLNQGGPANKKTRFSNTSESEQVMSTSERSEDRRLPDKSRGLSKHHNFYHTTNFLVWF